MSHKEIEEMLSDDEFALNPLFQNAGNPVSGINVVFGAHSYSEFDFYDWLSFTQETKLEDGRSVSDIMLPAPDAVPLPHDVNYNITEETLYFYNEELPDVIYGSEGIDEVYEGSLFNVFFSMSMPDMYELEEINSVNVQFHGEYAATELAGDITNHVPADPFGEGYPELGNRDYRDTLSENPHTTYLPVIYNGFTGGGGEPTDPNFRWFSHPDCNCHFAIATTKSR